MKFGILSYLSRNRRAHFFLGILFLWSLLSMQAVTGGVDLNRPEQRAYFAQGQDYSLPVVADPRGKQSADHQINAFTRAPQDVHQDFERTATAERDVVVRAFIPFQAYVIYTQHTSSDL